ncbi:unnamed protein product [Adineta steineri]|uniref:PKS/mFAS DH domain-containing protein n=1 Tax=Adineta steineri TaxID=433720 RepID=A0A819S7J9_9BILA|nr:unnamed protein product [Adineta steineri]
MSKINNGEWRLLEELIEKKNEEESRINDTNIAQPMLLAIQVALVALLVLWNIYPSSIISRSAGDQAAAFVAGRLTLEETVRMLAVSMSEEEIENKLLKGIEHLACITVVNSTRSVTRSSDEMQQILSISYPNVFKACVRIENAFHSYQMNRFDIENDMLLSLKKIFVNIQYKIKNKVFIQYVQHQNFIQSNVRQAVRFYDTIAAIIKDEVANVFLEISPHPVLAISIRECYGLTSQQPFILLTLKGKENEQITLLTSLAQLTTSSHVWQQYFHTRQILSMKNHEEYFDDFPLFKFHLSSYWYESKDSSIQRLANRIPTHSLLGIHQLNDQTNATWKNHKIQDAILFPAVAYFELAIASCQQLLSPKEDDQQQQQATIIFEDVKFVKVLILNEHELVEVFIQIIMPMREWYIIFCNQDNLNKYSFNEFTLHAQGKIEIDSKQQKSLTIPDRWTIQDIRSAYAHLSTRAYQYGSSFQKKIKTLHGTSTTIISQLSNDNNNCSSYYLLHPYLVLLPGVETTFLPVPILKFIYSSKTKAKMNRSINVEVRGKIWTDSPTIKDISHLLPSPNQILNNQLNSISNQDLTESIEPFNELATYYAQMAIKDLDLNQQHHPLLNAYILSGEKTGLDIFVGDEEIAQTFQQVKTLLSAIKTQQIFHSICQHLQLQYERQTKDDNSFENYRLRIFWLTDSDCSDVLPILDLLLNLSPQTGLLIDLHYADSNPIQLANAQQTFNTHINNQTKNFSIIYDETIDLYDSKTLEKIPFESFDIIFSSNLPLGNQDLTNSLIDLRRLLELVHIPLYFDLNFGFIDQWWSSDNVDKNNRVLNNIQQRTALLEQIEGFNFIESTLNENENTLIIIYVLINNAQFNNDSNLNIIPSRFIGFERIVLRLNHTNHNQVQHLILHYGMLQNNNEQKKSKLEHISIIPKREVDQKLFRPCISPSRFLSPLTWIEEDREEELLPSDMVD